MQHKATHYLKVTLLLLCTSSYGSQLHDSAYYDGEKEQSFIRPLMQNYMAVKTSKKISHDNVEKALIGLNFSQKLIGRDCSIFKMEVYDRYRPTGKLQTFLICAQSVAGDKHAEFKVRELASKGASFNLFYEVGWLIDNCLESGDYANLLTIKNTNWGPFFSRLPLISDNNSMDTVIAVARGRDERDEAIIMSCSILPTDLVISLLLRFDESSPKVFKHVRKVREEIKAYRESKKKKSSSIS